MPDQQKTLESLVELVASSADAPSAVYMVLDSSVKKGILQDLWKKAPPVFGAPLLDCDEDPDLYDCAPFLLQLDTTRKSRRYATTLAQQEAAGIFFTAQEPWKEVLEQAKAWLWPQKEDGRYVYFRYYDPRIFSALFLYHQKADAPCPVGSFASVFWHDPFREETFSYTAPERGKPFCKKEPWKISIGLEEELMAVQTLNRVLSHIGKMHPEYYETTPMPILREQAAASIAQAEEYGFFSFKDTLEFCHCSFLYPRFLQHQKIQDLFIPLKKKHHGTSFASVLKNVPDVWLFESTA